MFPLRYEMDNLLMPRKTDDAVIGKAEGLEALLVEWMHRHDGKCHYYLDPRYSYWQTRGDIQEITEADLVERSSLGERHDDCSGCPARVAQNGNVWHRRNEYPYLGRTFPGTVTVSSITFRGADASYFTVSPTSGTID
jgi:hypothetical protein